MSKIIVFCGSDIVSSRIAFKDYLQSLKINDFEVIYCRGKDLTKETLSLNFEALSLFGKKRVLAIENFFSGTKSQDDLIKHLLSLKEKDVVFWETKEFSANQQNPFPGIIFKKFTLPEVVFKFLESLQPGKPGENLAYFFEARQATDINFLFLMLVRQIRLLILAKEPECLGKIAPWQKKRLLAQTKMFSQEKLIDIYKKLFLIDFEQKTSSSPFNLGSSLDLLISEI